MYGNCFTFNTSKVGSHVSGTGPYNGMSVDHHHVIYIAGDNLTNSSDRFIVGS
jgi:hypothetical protein